MNDKELNEKETMDSIAKARMKPEVDYPPYRYFICSCDTSEEEDKRELSYPEIKEHLQNCHNVNIPEDKGDRSLTIHINRKPRHVSRYKWTIKDIVFYEYVG